jgi:hypothetical protein
LPSATLGKAGPRQKRRQVMAEATHAVKLCRVLGLSTRQSKLLCQVSGKALGKDFFKILISNFFL